MSALYKPKCEYDATFKFPPLVYESLIANGLWPTHVRKHEFLPRVYQKIYILWFCINLGIAAFVIAAELRYFFENINDITKAVENLCTTVIGLQLLVRFIHMRYASNQLKRVMEIFSKEIWINRKNYPTIYDRCMGKTKPTTILSLSLLTVLIIYTALPIMSFLTSDKTMMSTDKPLPFSTIFPYDHQPYWTYIFTFFISFYVGFVTVSQYYALDALFIHIAAFYCGQFEIMHGNILRLVPECHAQWQLTTDPNEAADIKKLELRYTRSLKKIAQRHRVLIRELDKFISFPLAINFFISTFLICFLGFQFLVSGKNSLQDFLRSFLYLLSIIGQLYIVCKLGTLLITQSENTAIYLYMCNWEGGYLSQNSPLILKPDDMDLKQLNSILPSWRDINYYPPNRDFQQKLRFMIMRSNWAVDLKAVHYMVLSLETCSRILSSSLSFFTLLQTFLDKQNNEHM